MYTATIVRRKLAYGLCFILFSCSFSVASAQVVAKPRLTEAQAIQIARQFCQQIGQPISAKASAQYPAPEDFPDQTHHFWQTCWKINFGPNFYVEVIDATSVIRGYENRDYYHKSLAEQSLPISDFISKQEALQKAEFTLHATRQTDELSSPEIRFEEIARPVKHGTTDWSIRWTRLSHSIPYREDGASIVLDGESGEVISVGLGYFSPPASVVRQCMRRGETVATASSVLIQVGLPNAVPETHTLIRASERMENPNTFWQDGDENHMLPGPAVPVYVHVYRANEIDYEVWVNMETGQVAGGSYYSLRGNLTRPQLKRFIPKSKMLSIGINRRSTTPE